MSFTSQEIKDFQRNGWVRLPAAFPREAALQMQDFMWEKLAENGIARDDATTWNQSWAGLNHFAENPIFAPVSSPRLCATIDALLGAGTWEKPKSWGGFLVSPPHEKTGPWDVASDSWHWDGAPQDHLNGLQGLFIFTFYGEVAPREGGTLLLSGSHQLIERFFREMSPETRQKKQKALKARWVETQPYLRALSGLEGEPNRIARFMEQETEIDGVPLRVVEATGQPGDAIVCHPSIWHAISQHHGEKPRFMRVKGLTKKSHE